LLGERGNFPPSFSNPRIDTVHVQCSVIQKLELSKSSNNNLSSYYSNELTLYVCMRTYVRTYTRTPPKLLTDLRLQNRGHVTYDYRDGLCSLALNVHVGELCMYVCVFVCVCVCVCVRPRVRARVCVHTRAYTDKLHIQRWRPNGWPDRDPNLYKYSFGAIGTSYLSRLARSARNRGGAAVPRKRKAGEQARSARVHEMNMAAYVKTV
jgi:hypothetical protein